MSFSCQSHVTEAVFDSLRPEWDALDLRTSPRRPYTSELWNRLWWKHFRRHGALTRDDLSIFTVRDGQGQLVAVAPMMVTHRPPTGPLRLRHLQFFGADASITEIRGLVCDPHHQTEATGVLHQHFRSISRAWDVIAWHGLRDGTADIDALREGSQIKDQRELPDYFLNVPDSWDAVFATFSQNMRRKARKAYSDLEKDGVTFKFNVVSDPRQTPAALQRFVTLHCARAQGDTSLVSHHSNRLGNPVHRDFILDLAQGMAERGQLCVFQIEIAGEVVATQLAFVMGDEIYMYFSGFEPAWAPYNIMTTLMIEAIKWSIRAKLKRFNLSTGKDLSKTRWNPEEIKYHSMTLMSPNIRSHLVAYCYDAALHMRSYASQIAQRTR